ncbi:MAG: prolipoprotein diacylglyceryl transferase [Actinomycetota bacterium]
MRPVLFHWLGRAIPSYPAMLYLGLVFGLVAGNVAAKAAGLNGARVYVASLILLPPALVGARFVSVVGNWNAYRRTPGRIWRRSEGGQAMYGGLVVVPLSLPLLAALGLPFWGFWDVAIFTMLTGMIFARVGCLLNGCCAGRTTESRFGLLLAGQHGVRTRRIPMQVIEGSLGAILLAGASVLAVLPAPPGSVFTVSLAAYALARLFLQPLREVQGSVASIPALRTASAALLAVAVLLFLPQID